MHIECNSILQSNMISFIVYGNFKKIYEKEIIITRGSFLELFLFEKRTRRIISSTNINFFAKINNCFPFRLKNEHKDYVVINNDAGDIIIVGTDTYGNFFQIDNVALDRITNIHNLLPFQFAFDAGKLVFMLCNLGSIKIIFYIQKNFLFFALHI